MNLCLRMVSLLLLSRILLSSGILFAQGEQEAEEQQKPDPIILNGDKMEYSADHRESTVTGNVEVNYKGSILTCDTLRINVETKDARAAGNARIEEKNAVIEGSELSYNFETKKGLVSDAQFRSPPFFGKGEKINKISDDEFVILRGYATACDYDKPHYRLKSRKVNFFPGDKIQTKEDTFFLGPFPLFYLPQYNHSLKDPLMHVQLLPGQKKKWGQFMLSAWRYTFSENIRGRIYLDYRRKLGVAEGFGTNYEAEGFGKGDFKYYYTQERNKTKDFPEEDTTIPRKFQRFFIRWRHKWDIDEKTNFTSEYYKIVDSKRILHPGGSYDFLKEYFPREYERDSMPLSYALLHRSFDYASLDILMQKRVNRWYSQGELLPQIRFSLPDTQLWDSRFYFQHDSSYVNTNQKAAVPSDSSNDVSDNIFSTSNKFSIPVKASIFRLVPFISSVNTHTGKGRYGATLDTTLSAGSDMTTKFYRIFNLRSNFLGLDIDGLRHIVSPTATYAYNSQTLMPAGRGRIGSSDTVPRSAMTLELSNKFQTKRQGIKSDLADIRASSSYQFNPKTGDKIGSFLSDILLEAELRPYSWLSFDGDTTYKRSGNDDDVTNSDYKHFSNANYDIGFNLGKERGISFGQRYQRKGGNDLTFSLQWRLSPKWKAMLYQRYDNSHVVGAKRGIIEREYSLIRDLHCWSIELTYNARVNEGETIWLVFRLKAFPEMEFEFNRQYHMPKPGSQGS